MVDTVTVVVTNTETFNTEYVRDGQVHVHGPDLLAVDVEGSGARSAVAACRLPLTGFLEFIQMVRSPSGKSSAATIR